MGTMKNILATTAAIAGVRTGLDLLEKDRIRREANAHDFADRHGISPFSFLRDIVVMFIANPFQALAACFFAFLILMFVLSPFVIAGRYVQHGIGVLTGANMLPINTDKYLMERIDYDVVILGDNSQGSGESKMVATVTNPTDIPIKGVGISCHLYFTDGHPVPNAIHTMAIPPHSTRTFTNENVMTAYGPMTNYTCSLKYITPQHEKWWDAVK